MLPCLMANMERNIPAVLRLLVLLPTTIVFKLRVHVGSRTASPLVVPPLAFTETERLFSATHKPKPLISTHSKQFNAKT